MKRKWIITICLIPVLSVMGYSFSLYLNDILISDKAKEGWLDLVEETKKISFPKTVGHVCNPGIIPYEDGYLMTFRAGSKDITSWIKRHLKMEKKTHIAFIQLNKAFEPISDISYIEHTSILDPLGINMGEDARLITCQGKQYAVYNDVNLEEGEYVKRVHVGEVVKTEGRFSLENIVMLRFPEAPSYYAKGLVTAKLEKNWIPFVYDDTLHLVYILEPQVILKPDLKTGLCEKVSENELIKLSNIGIARGGTPALPIEDGYLAFFHTCLKGEHRFPKLHKTLHPKSSVYCFSAYVFEGSPPFQVKKKLPGFVGGDGLFTERRKMVYPSGCLMDDQFIYLFSGISDHYMVVSKIRKDKLFASFIDV